MQIFIAKLSYDTTAEDLDDLFSQYGEVSSTKVIYDRDTGKSKGYGFVEMPDTSAAYDAINDLNGTDFDGREILVKRSNLGEDSKHIYDHYHHGRGSYRDHDHYHSDHHSHYSHHWIRY